MFIFSLYLIVAAHASCPAQEPLDHLVRGKMFLRDAQGRVRRDPEGRRFFQDKVKESIAWRTRAYGFVDVPEGRPYRALNPSPAASQAEEAEFMGLKARFHRRMIPALKCVEAEIAADPECAGVAFEVCERRNREGVCVKSRTEIYVPAALSGLRERNTYRGGEISNHVFGLAIDIDPERNPCCGCVADWARVPKCSWNVPRAEMADLPACWVRAFKRHGFHWLGEDDMGDTMHFEFLGDPDRLD